MKLNVFVVDDDPFIHSVIDKMLAGKSRFSEMNVVHCDSPKAALLAFEKSGFHVAFIDLHYAQTKEDGFYLLKELSKIDKRLELVVLSSQNDFTAAQKAIRAGASDYLVKGFGREEFEQVLERALARRRWKFIESSVRSTKLAEPNRIIGDSRAIKEIKLQIAKAATTDIPILIEAETGSGKELVAKSIHEHRSDNSLPFIAVDCGAIPKTLADSFFFGHEKGAFTGAENFREGVFEHADGGTLFLDEINSLDIDMQAKLLRVLQEKEFRRLGSNKLRSSDFKLVAAANKSLEAMIEAGTFREDLFYRINAIRIEIPPLKKRLGDLKHLARHILPHRRFHSDVIGMFRGYSWPGNIRELKNTLLAIDVLVDESEEVSLRNLPDQIKSKLLMRPEKKLKSLTEIKEQKVRDEFRYFNDCYKNCRGNLSEVARLTGMDRSYLHHKLIKLGIHRARKIII